MGPRAPEETQELILAANERTLVKLLSSSLEMVKSFLLLSRVLRRSCAFTSPVLRTVSSPVYESEYSAARRYAIARPIAPAAPVTINVP